MRRIQRLILSLLLSLSWVTDAQTPHRGDLIELQGMLNARRTTQTGSVDFRTSTHDNKLYVLAAGSRGRITQVKALASGNFGIKVQLMNVAGINEEVWVYYQPSNDNIKLYELNKDNSKKLDQWWADAAIHKKQITVAHKYKQTDNAGQATHLQTTRSTAALSDTQKENNSLANRILQEATQPYSNTIISPEENLDTQTLNALALDKINSAREARGMIGNPAGHSTGQNTAVACNHCSQKPIAISNPTCNDKNNYIQKVIEQQSHLPVLQVLSQHRPQVKLMSCVEKRMASIGGRYVDCDSSKQPREGVAKACLSYDYKALVTSAFELVTDCTSDLVTNSQNPVIQDNYKSLMYAIVSQESGFHVNIRPHNLRAADGRAAMDSGLGQFTGDGIAAANENIDALKREIKNDSKHSCQKIEQMQLPKMSASAKNRCDATSIAKGNPALNLVYTAALMKTNKQYFLNLLNVTNTAARRNFHSLDQETQNLILNYVSAWSHHHPAVRTNVIAALATKRGLGIISMLTSISDKEKAVEKFMMDVVKSEKRSYIRNIITRSNEGSDICLN